MFILPRTKPLLLVSLSALLLLGGCERKGVEDPNTRPRPDPRMAKNFIKTEPEFCTFDMVYNETTGEGETATNTDVVTRVVFTGDDQSATAEALAATCKAGSDASNSVCAKYVASRAYKCVAASIFNSAPATTGLWSCSIEFTANDKKEPLTVENKSTANEAIAAMFTNCAALTDEGTNPAQVMTPVKTAADPKSPVTGTTPVTMTPSPTPSSTPVPTPPIYVKPSKRRDACAAAMIAEKMTCQNANDLPETNAAPLPKRHLYREKKHH